MMLEKERSLGDGSDKRDRPGQTVGRSFLFIYALSVVDAPSRDRRFLIDVSSEFGVRDVIVNTIPNIHKSV